MARFHIMLLLTNRGGNSFFYVTLRLFAVRLGGFGLLPLCCRPAPQLLLFVLPLIKAKSWTPSLTSALLLQPHNVVSPVTC